MKMVSEQAQNFCIDVAYKGTSYLIEERFSQW
ncbi:hypothetical protein EDB60_110146 [Vibrio crassostreae]|nr:hypothetical protein EDB60_110146 [Vibrio crassostreae]TCW20189.1 hypothetical protein EDB48_104135 [Vibrio crassostreae]